MNKSPLAKYYFYNKKSFVLLMIVKLLNAILEVSLSIFLYLIVDLVSSGAGITNVIYFGLIFLLNVLLTTIFAYLDLYLSRKYVNYITEVYRKDVISNIFNSDYKTINSQTSAQWITVIEKNIDSISENNFMSFFDLISQTSTLLIAIAVSFAFNWIVTLVTIAMSIFIALTPRLFTKKIYSAFDDINESNLELSGALDDPVKGIVAVKNSFSVNRIVSLIEEKQISLREAKNRYWKAVSSNNNVTNLFIYLLRFSAVFVSCILSIYNLASISVCVAFLQLSSCIFSPVIVIVGSITYIKSVKEVVKKIASIKPEVSSNQAFEQFNSICVKSLSVTRSGNLLLNDVSYSFSKGKKYLITGESGIGKTTFLNTLIGINRDYDGKIFLNNYDASSLSSSDLSHYISYCGQKPLLFKGSIADNITMFSSDPNEEKLHKVIELCQLNGFVAKRGIDSVIDNATSTISQGEMQRISLARTLYQDRPVILLDEITASLDSDNSKKIYEALKNIEGKTMLWISHDDAAKSLKWIDKKIRIIGGKLVEFD